MSHVILALDRAFGFVFTSWGTFGLESEDDGLKSGLLPAGTPGVLLQQGELDSGEFASQP